MPTIAFAAYTVARADGSDVEQVLRERRKWETKRSRSN